MQMHTRARVSVCRQVEAAAHARDLPVVSNVMLNSPSSPTASTKSALKLKIDMSDCGFVWSWYFVSFSTVAGSTGPLLAATSE